MHGQSVQGVYIATYYSRKGMNRSVFLFASLRLDAPHNTFSWRHFFISTLYFFRKTSPFFLSLSLSFCLAKLFIIQLYDAIYYHACVRVDDITFCDVAQPLHEKYRCNHQVFFEKKKYTIIWLLPRKKVSNENDVRLSCEKNITLYICS